MRFFVAFNLTYYNHLLPYNFNIGSDFLDKKSQYKNMAKEWIIGETSVKICVDYCVKTHAEVTKILNNVAQDVWPDLSNSF